MKYECPYCHEVYEGNVVFRRHLRVHQTNVSNRISMNKSILFSSVRRFYAKYAILVDFVVVMVVAVLGVFVLKAILNVEVSYW